MERSAKLWPEPAGKHLREGAYLMRLRSRIVKQYSDRTRSNEEFSVAHDNDRSTCAASFCRKKKAPLLARDKTGCHPASNPNRR